MWFVQLFILILYTYHGLQTKNTARCKHQSCKPLFRSLGILTITSQFILSLMKFLLKNQEKFTSNSEVRNINTRNELKLHKPISNLTLYKKGVYYMSIRIFSKLPDCIARLVENKRSFVSTLRLYLVSKSFYCLEEFFDD